MDGVSGGVSGGVAGAAATDKKPPNKRETNAATNKGKSPAAKRRRTSHVNHKKRNSTTYRSLGGSVSDPLNLGAWSDDNATPTVDKSRHLGDQSRLPLPRELHDDPLNLEGKITNFETIVGKFNKQLPVSGPSGRPLGTGSGKHRNSFSNNFRNKRRRSKGNRNRKKSHSESSSDPGQLNHTSSTSSDKPSKSSKPAALYRYGNYDRYYGYRNNGTQKDDPRVTLLDVSWFNGKDCLDIGSNTGHVTMNIARLYSPRSITGIDIDSKLVRIAQKNLQQVLVSSTLPDGRSVPRSILMSFGPVDWLTKGGGGARVEGKYPNNVNFIQGNYVPFCDESLHSTTPEYDVILCLSVTKWIQLNWGDEALKRMFKKMYMNLRDNGRLILEPQPWSSYGRKKRISPDLFENYQKIKFMPDQFNDYLLSSEVGFTEHQYLGISDNSSPGFQRPIHVYLKGVAQPKPHPLISIETSSATVEPERPHPLDNKSTITDNVKPMDS